MCIRFPPASNIARRRNHSNERCKHYSTAYPSLSQCQLRFESVMLVCLFESSVKKCYKNGLCSVAFAANAALLAFAFIAPFIVAYNSQGLWVKEVTCREQPNVTFKHDLLLQVERKNGTTFWASDDFYNDKVGSYSVLPFLKCSEQDLNFDKLHDRFTLHLKTTLQEEVYGVELMLIFNYELKCLKRIVLEGAAFLQLSHWKALSALKVLGELTLHQNILFPSTADNLEFDVPILPHGVGKMSAWRIHDILRQYSNRNVTTRLANVYTTYETRPTADYFELDLEISYPKQDVRYHPSFWHILKWVWVQYLSLLTVSLYFMNKIRRWIFTNKIARTYVYDQYKKRI